MSLYYILITCMDFDHLVFEKVYFNLIKLSLFCFIYFFFLLLFFISFWFFLFFLFTRVRTIPPKALGLGVELGVGAIFLWDNCPRTAFTGGKKWFFTCQRNVRFYSFIICAKLHLFVDAKRTKWSKLYDVLIFQT